MIFARYLRPNNLSQKMMWVIFSIYLGVTCLVMGMQFLSEYLKTRDSILNELKQLEETFHAPISTSLWQYNHNQLDALVAGLVKMPIIQSVNVLDMNAHSIMSKKSETLASAPLSSFYTKSDLFWTLNDKKNMAGIFNTLFIFRSCF